VTQNLQSKLISGGLTLTPKHAEHFTSENRQKTKESASFSKIRHKTYQFHHTGLINLVCKLNSDSAMEGFKSLKFSFKNRMKSKN